MPSFDQILERSSSANRVPEARSQAQATASGFASLYAKRVPTGKSLVLMWSLGQGSMPGFELWVIVGSGFQVGMFALYRGFEPDFENVPVTRCQKSDTRAEFANTVLRSLYW